MVVCLPYTFLRSGADIESFSFRAVLCMKFLDLLERNEALS